MEAKNDGKMERLYPSSFKYDTILRYLCYIEGGLQIAHVGGGIEQPANVW